MDDSNTRWLNLTSEQRQDYVDRYVKNLSPEEQLEIEDAIAEMEAGHYYTWEEVKAEMNAKNGLANA